MGHTLNQFLNQARSELAYTDDLTGLFNARLLSALFQSWWQELLAAHDSLTLIIIDLDGFKDVNDRYGHLTGNEVLKATAEVLRRHFRSDDIVIRYGGDEFVIVLPGAGRDVADQLAERAREALAGSSFSCIESGEPVAVTVSFSLGAATFPGEGRWGQELLQHADRLLLADKDRRRGPRGVPGRKPLWTALAVFVTMALAATITYVVVIKSRPPAVELVEPSPGLPTDRDATMSSAPSREEELLAQIGVLEAHLSTLTQEMNRQSADHQRQYQGEIEGLVAQIRELEAEARDGRTRGDAATAASPPATPVVVVGETDRPTPSAGTAPEDGAVDVPGDEAPQSVVVPPLPVSRVEPRYPEMARRFGIERSVDFRVVVGTNGRVLRADPVGPSVGYGLDRAAHEAALKVHYQPATVNGVPVEMAITLTIHFRLDRSSGD